MKNKIILLVIALVLITMPFLWLSISTRNSPKLIEIPFWSTIWEITKTVAIIFWELAKRPLTWGIISIFVGVSLFKKLLSR